ncbi:MULTISPECIES: amino acid ABC transporter permease [Nocardioides]|uniref:Amino acid ABC transporter permease n=1 Tax=Nocardioides vastitatis TaxID=2568655 RepID=A0ABW0ZF08_9ACTN|nr:amino acid ABC transporter permease [Nocardioides sp.]THI93010.1 amino acid ABC transporter permease [Nocardioides sp.]
MSGNVLFDSPGPKTVLRHRIYTLVASAALLGLLTWFVLGLHEDGQFEYDKWEPFLTPAYLEVLLVDGLLKTLQMAFVAILAAVVYGTVFGIGKLSDHALIRWPSALVVEFFRATPVLLLMIFIWYALGISKESSSYWAVVIALTLYNGSVLAEVLRAGINAVPKGQSEAAYALGMRKTQVMSTILLPQAVKIMLPAIISQCVVALKDTALGYAVVAPGLTRVGKAIYQEFDNQIPTMAVIALLYIVVNLLLTLLATWAQKKFVGEKKPLEVSMVGIVDDGRAV